MTTLVYFRLALFGYLLFLTSFLLVGQTTVTDTCGTEIPTGAELDTLLARHQAFADSYNPGGGIPLLAGLRIVPVQLHIVSQSNGMGGIPEASVTAALTIVNMRYQAAGLVFVVCNTTNLIMDDALFDINGKDEGDNMSDLHNVSNVLNLYFVNDLFNDDMDPLCGWAYYSSSNFLHDYVILDNDCVSNGSTLSHEIGHYFDLFHTHETSCGAELVNGSNCMTAGDKICDTPADPNLDGKVDAACMYTGTDLDANMDPYLPLTNNLMSYSTKACRDNFTAAQLAKIAFTAANARAYVSVLSCPGETKFLDANCQFILPDYRDSMILHTDCAFVDTTQMPPPGTVINMDGSTEVTIMVTDANMDFATCTFTVYHLDTTPPTIAMIPDDTIITNADCMGIIGDYRDSTMVSDNCDPNPMVTQIPPPGTNLGGVGAMQTIQIIAEDNEGNISTLDVNVVVIDADSTSQLNCKDLNLSIDLANLVQFRLDEMVSGANCTELHSLSIENAYGGIIYQADNLIRNSLVSFPACAYIGQQLKATVTNQAGASCWGYLTIKQGNGPILTGRSFDLWCYDARVSDIQAYHDSVGYPPALIPCKVAVQPSFVADWVQPYDCVPGVQDTAKIIYREYEAFDKSGKRTSVFDTLVIYRIPKLHTESFFCPGNFNLYCSDTAGFVSPAIIFGNGNLTGSVDLIKVQTNGGELKFLPAVLDPKCGLQVKVDYWKYGESTCLQEYKIAVELKQTCPGSLSNLVVSVISPNAFIPLDADSSYWRCEFWLTDQDTTPPLVAHKVFGEYECLVLDTSDLLGGNFFEAFVPLVSTSTHDCVAYTTLPPVCVSEDWSGIKVVKATIEGMGSYLLHPTTDSCLIFDLEDGAISFGGELGEQAIMELMNQFDSLPPDLLGLLKYGTCYRSEVKVPLPKRETPYLVIYEVMDSCHLIGRDTALIKVKDQTKPVAVADKGVTVSLSDKKVWVDAKTFDEGSWDNCGIEFILARRADWTEACVDLCYNNDDTICKNKESALCWLWTDGHDTLWIPELERDKHCDEVEAHYRKQLDWFCKDESACGKLLYNSWLYELMKYATVECKGDGHLTDEAFDKLFRRAVANPARNDQFKITNDTLLAFLRSFPEFDSYFIDSNHISGAGYLLIDIFKCEDVLSNYCIDLFGDGFNNQIFSDPEYIQFLISGGCLSAFETFFPEIFAPIILPDDLQTQVIDNWKNIGGGWSDAVPFSCEDACGPVTVEILVMDYWCNWSTAWTNVWVEDKTPINVVKDVVEQEVITCKVYKESNYSYPGEQHPVSIQYIVEQAKTGQQNAFDALDGIFGGYCKAWIDPYGNYVDSNGLEIECDIPFYDSICDCKDTIINIRVYDEHLGYLWIDSTVKECYYYADTLNFQKGIVAVNCAENVYCEQEVWCDFDHCGQGYIFRKFKIWQGCPEGSYAGMPDSLKHPVDTIYRHQRIWVGNECELDKYMFDVPYDTEVFSCDIVYGPDGNVVGDAGPENTGYATYKFDDDCRIVGIAHEDKVFKVVGGDAACYKILRTWYFADWCTYGGDVPNGKWWLDDGIVRDKCVQKIIVRDTVAPVCVITGPVASGDSVSLAACDYDLAVRLDVSDACGVISYYWELKDITDAAKHLIFDSGSGDLDGEVETDFIITSDDLYPGTYKLVVQIKDDCSNESYCEYVITVTSAKKPAPVCITSLTARLTPWDSDGDGEVDTAHAIVWAYEYDRSSTPACEDDSLEYRLEFREGNEDDETAAGDLDFLEVGCADIGTHLVRLWVISHPSGSSDYCDAVLVVQSDFSGCTTQGTGEQVMVNSTENPINAEPGTDKRTISKSDKTINVSEDHFGIGQQSVEGFNLEQNQPNPFKYETRIGFTLPKSMEVKLEVFDVNGRLVRSFNGKYVKGLNQVELQGTKLEFAGVFYYRLTAANYSATRKMILLE